jgi:hypothetical protein
VTRKILVGLTLACSAALMPAAARADRAGHEYPRREQRPAEHWRGDEHRHGDDHATSSFRIDIGSILGGPACEPQAVQVWVEPVYQTVIQRVWVPEVTQRVVDRVWMPAHYEWRDVRAADPWHPVTRRQVLVSGYYEDRPRVVVVAPGHYEDRPMQQLVTPGHWETRYAESQRPWFGLGFEYRN